MSTGTKSSCELSYGSLDALLDDKENIVQDGGGQLIRLHAVQLHSLGHQYPWLFQKH